MRGDEANWAGVDMAFWLAVVEQLRHVIVHCEGTLLSFEFWEAMASKTGKQVTGNNRDSRYRQEVGLFVQEAGGVATVSLLKRDVPPLSTNNIVMPFKNMYRVLTSHAALVYKTAMHRAGGHATWERPEGS